MHFRRLSGPMRDSLVYEGKVTRRDHVQMGSRFVLRKSESGDFKEVNSIENDQEDYIEVERRLDEDIVEVKTSILVIISAGKENDDQDEDEDRNENKMM